MVKTDVERNKRIQTDISGLRCIVLNCGQQLGHVAFHQVEQKRLLIWRVIVQRPGLHAHFSRDGAHGNSRVPPRRKKLERGLAHFRAGDV